MKKRALAMILLSAILFCSSCSQKLNPSVNTSTDQSTEAKETLLYDGPAPEVFVFNPEGTCDTVDPEIRSYIQAAHEQYVSGDTSFTVQNAGDLGNKPVPVEFSFTVENRDKDALSDPVLEISEDPEFSEFWSIALVNIDFKNETYTKSVYNLKTGTEYYWRVSMTAQERFKTKSEVFSFKTEPGPRILSIEGISNARDIGGWDTVDGKTIREGLVYRSARPDDATSAGKRIIKEDLGIKTELDLRNPDLASDQPMNSPFKSSLNYININTKSYTYFEQVPEKTARILRVFAKPSNYPILFHCSGGADRTGVWAFVLKALCGGDEIDLICDYELTNNRTRMGYTTPSYDFPFPKFYNALLSLPGNSLQEKIYTYYHDQCGVSEMELANIIAIMTTDSAVFTDPPKKAIEVKGGSLSIPITLRSSEGVKSVATTDGKEIKYDFTGDTLTLTIEEIGEGSGTITFTDGSQLPILWVNP